MIFQKSLALALMVFVSIQLQGTSAACKSLSLPNTNLRYVPGKCISTLTSSALLTCTPTTKTAALYSQSGCAGSATSSRVLSLTASDVCGSSDTDCFVGSFVFQTEACTGASISVYFVPGACTSDSKWYCDGNNTVISHYANSACTGNALYYSKARNEVCTAGGGIALRYVACQGGPVAPAPPSTTPADAYYQIQVSTTSACSDNSLTSIYPTDGTCITGTSTSQKYYCNSNGTQVTSVQFNSASCATSSVWGITQSDTGNNCVQGGPSLYGKRSCSAGSSPVTSTEKLTAGSMIELDYFLDSTCGTKVGYGSYAVDVCYGDTIYACTGSTSANVKKYDSGSGACNDSQTSPIVTTALSASCSNVEGTYVKVTNCVTSAAGILFGGSVLAAVWIGGIAAFLF